MIKGSDKLKLRKMDLLIYMYSGRLTIISYCIAILIVIIPIFTVLFIDISLSSFLSKIIMSSAFFFFILGKFLVITNNKKENKSISGDVGIITGVAITYLSYIIN